MENYSIDEKIIKPSCSICAWRGTCNKKFYVTDPSKCIDYTLDLSIDFSKCNGDKNED